MAFTRDTAGNLIHTGEDGTVTKVDAGEEHAYVHALHASERQHPVPPPGTFTARPKRIRKPRASKK